MICPNCQHDSPAQAKFCMECGKALSQTESRGKAQGETQRASSEAAPPGGHARGGERRHATVLFSDLSGYTSMNELLDPEEVGELMGRIKAEAVAIVEAHGGIVNQFVGDEVLALFGIPIAHEDDPSRAVRAAQELHHFVRRISPEVEQKIGRPLRMHSGLDTGLVVTSTRDKRDGVFGVTGDTVNTGARLKGLAEDDQILLSPDTQRHVAPFFETEQLAKAKLKGKSGAMAPFRVAGKTAIETRFEASELRGLSAFSGREQELDTLRTCLNKALAGSGQLVTVTGEAGIGKSRLLHEFRQSLQRDKVNVLEGRCQSYGGNTPYLPLIDALRRGLQLTNEVAAEVMVKKVVASVKAIDPALEKHLPAYLHFLSLPSEEFTFPQAMTGAELRRELQEAYTAITTQSTKEKATVFFLEDWHWADESSHAALMYLLEQIAPYPLLIVVNYRPEIEHDWGRRQCHTAIDLTHLDTVDGKRIVRAVLEVSEFPDGLWELIHEQTGGNPFFIEETCRDMLEEGALAVKNGQAELTRPLDKLRLPNTVHSVIRSRLDRLLEDHLDVLRLASVIGREFDQRLLEQARTGGISLSPILKSLRKQDLIQQVRALPEAIYIFKHVLTQVVVYETLLIERRKTQHELVGRALEEMYADHLEEHYETLAHHYLHSNDTEKALSYLELAGDKATGYFALEDARTYYRMAVALLESSHTDHNQKTQQIDLTIKWLHIAYFSKEQRYFEALESAERIARELGDERREARILCVAGRIGIYAGETLWAQGQTQKALEIAQRLGDEVILAQAHNMLGRACYYTGAYIKGISSLEKAIPMLEKVADTKESNISRSVLMRLYGWIGEFSHVQSSFEELLRRAGSAQDPEAEARARVYKASICLLQGDWEQMSSEAKTGGALADSVGNTLMGYSGRFFTGYSMLMVGDGDNGIRLVQQSLEGFIAEDAFPVLSLFVWSAELFALNRQPEEADRYLKIIEQKIAASQQNSVLPLYERVRALLSSVADPPDWNAAKQHMNNSIEAAAQMQARPELAVTHFRYAELLKQMSELGQARHQIDKATGLFREMEMSWWLDQAQQLRSVLEQA